MHRIGHSFPRYPSPSIGRPLGIDASASPPEGTTSNSFGLLVRHRVGRTSPQLERQKHREGNIGLLLPRLQNGDADSDSPIVMRVGEDEIKEEKEGRGKVESGMAVP
jgi:hypothetical protein